MAKSRVYAIMFVLLLVEVLSSLESSMIMSALPRIVLEGGDVATAGWLVTAFTLVGAATAAIGARLGDMFGRRRLLLAIVAICAVGSAISALSTDFGVIVFGRALQGVSGAILPLCYGITRETVLEKHAPMWIGVITGGYALASGVGYIFGGFLADTGHWRGIFEFTAIYAVCILPLLFFVVPESTRTAPSEKFDVIGAVLLAPAIAAILYGITNGSRVGWDAGSTWLFIFAGVAALAFWTFYELNHKSPLINLRLLRHPSVAMGNIAGAVSAFGVMQLPLVTMMILQQPRLDGVGLAVSATVAGFIKLPSNILALFAASFGGYLSGKYSGRFGILVGSAICAVAWTFLLFFHDSVPLIVVGVMVCAFGSSMLLAAVPNQVLEGAPIERSSEVTGMSSVIRSMGGAVGVQVIAVMLASSQVTDPVSGSAFPSQSAYQLTFAVVAASALLICALCLFVGGKSRAPASATL
ncbi:MAG: MFS transporter, partial [Caulobacterales bacterium]